MNKNTETMRSSIEEYLTKIQNELKHFSKNNQLETLSNIVDLILEREKMAEGFTLLE